MPLMDISTTRVIEEVKKRPTLWNRSDPFYKNKFRRNRCWKEVFLEVVPNFDTLSMSKQKDADRAVQQRWKTARDAYMRNRGLMSSGATRKKYFYYDHLSFLSENSEVDTNSTTDKTTSNSSFPESPQAINNEDPLCTSSTEQTESEILLEVKEEDINTTEEENNAPNENNDGLENNNPYNMQIHTEIDIERNNESVNFTEEVPNEPRALKRKRVLKRKISPVSQHNKPEPNNEINKEILKMLKETTSLMKNDNMAFFLSMLPILHKFSDQQKLMFRSEVIRTAMKIKSQDSNRFD